MRLHSEERIDFLTAPVESETNPTILRPGTEPRRIMQAAGLLSFGDIISRVLGLLREMILANLFGTGPMVSAFQVAVLIPRNLFDLLIGGHVSGALVPVFNAHASADRYDDLWRLVSALLTLLTTLLAAIVLALEIFAPQVVYLSSSGSSPETLARAADFLRVTAPGFLFLSWSAIASGLLYALKRFIWPAFTGAAFNATIVIATLVLAPQMQIGAMAVGWLLGAMVQLLMQLPGLRDARLRLNFHWNHPDMMRLAALYAPVMISLVIDISVRTASYNFASQTGERSIPWMNVATTLIQFPQGLVAMAISTAILPTLSGHAAVDDPQKFRETLGQGLRLIIVMILPAVIGLFVLATPIIGLLFEHGQFTAHDTITTGLALRLYLIGLPFAAVDLLLVYAFYARQDTFTPALIGAFSLSIYMITASMLLPHFGFFSLMLADSVKHIIHAGLSAFILHRRAGKLYGIAFLKTTLRALAAALIMGAVVLAADSALAGLLSEENTLADVLRVVVPSVVGVVTFTLLAVLFKIDAFWQLAAALRGRFSRRI
jgi:putative peptidoglycan lipid II flippase